MANHKPINWARAGKVAGLPPRTAATSRTEKTTDRPVSSPDRRRTTGVRQWSSNSPRRVQHDRWRTRPRIRSSRSDLDFRSYELAEASATYELIAHLLPLVARRRRVLLMGGWIITDTGWCPSRQSSPRRYTPAAGRATGPEFHRAGREGPSPRGTGGGGRYRTRRYVRGSTVSDVAAAGPVPPWICQSSLEYKPAGSPDGSGSFIWYVTEPCAGITCTVAQFR
jgi:hypothetical protein